MAKKNSISRFLLAFVCCLAAGILIGWVAALVFGGRTGTVKLTICETTDTHGAYFDSLYVGDVANATSFANVASYLREVRADGTDPVLIDCGDNLQGDNAAYYYNFVRTDCPHLMTSIFKYLEYDAVVVGNHDIEPGHAVYDKMKKELGIPYLAANAVYDGGPDDGKPYFQEYTVIKRDGVKIAVIGMTNPNIKSWLSEEKWTGVNFVDISDIAQGIVDRVRKKVHPHLVILAVHSGEGDGQDGFENDALYLASNVRGVDILLYGHDHKAVACPVDGVGGEVAFLNAGTRNRNVARCDVTLEMKHGKVISRSFVNTLVPMTDYQPDSAYVADFRPCFEEVREFANRKIGTLTDDIDFSAVLEGPSPYISLVHAVQLDVTKAEISITAPLSTRGMVSKGDVTFQGLSELYRFENTLNKVVMTGKQIKDYLEYSYDHWIRRDGPSYNFDSAEGINYEVSVSAACGERVKILGMTSGEPFDPERKYVVAMNSYRASGGGDLLTEGAGIDPSTLETIEKYGDIRTLIGDYIKARGEVAPVAATNWKFVK